MWDTATDVSSIGETRRGREGDNWDVSLGFEVEYVRVRDFDIVFEGLCELLLWREGGPSDNRESASIHASRSPSSVIFGSRLDSFPNGGICVTNGIEFGRTGGG